MIEAVDESREQGGGKVSIETLDPLSLARRFGAREQD